MCMIHNCEHFELVFVKVMCKIRYRRIVRLLKQVSSIKFVTLNTSPATSVVPDPDFWSPIRQNYEIFLDLDRIGFHFCSSRIRIIQNVLNTF